MHVRRRSADGKYTEISMSFSMEYEWRPERGLRRIKNKSFDAPCRCNEVIEKKSKSRTDVRIRYRSSEKSKTDMDKQRSNKQKLKEITEMFHKEEMSMATQQLDRERRIMAASTIVITKEESQSKLSQSIKSQDGLEKLESNAKGSDLAVSPVSFKPAKQKVFKVVQFSSAKNVRTVKYHAASSFLKVKKASNRSIRNIGLGKPLPIIVENVYPNRVTESRSALSVEQINSPTQTVQPGKFALIEPIQDCKSLGQIAKNQKSRFFQSNTKIYSRFTDTGSGILSMSCIDGPAQNPAQEEGSAGNKVPDNIFKHEIPGESAISYGLQIDTGLDRADSKQMSIFDISYTVAKDIDTLNNDTQNLKISIMSRDKGSRKQTKNSFVFPAADNSELSSPPVPMDIEKPKLVESFIGLNEQLDSIPNIQLPLSNYNFLDRFASSPSISKIRGSMKKNSVFIDEVTSPLIENFKRRRKLSEINSENNTSKSANFLKINTSLLGHAEGSMIAMSQIECSQDNAFIKSYISRASEKAIRVGEVLPSPTATSPLTNPAAVLKENEIKEFLKSKSDSKLQGSKKEARSFSHMVAQIEDASPVKKHLNHPNGDTYFGDIRAGIREGQGMLKYSLGDTYQGGFKDDLPDGEGQMNFRVGDRYIGDFKEGKMHGQGVLSMADKSTYTGYFENGKMQGMGSILFANGEKYEGKFKNNFPHGMGKYIFLNGNSYTGDMYEGKITGRGLLKMKGGASYEGEFLDGRLHGEGIFTWKDGMFYEGAFINDLREGFGKILSKKGKTIYEGEFKEGNFDGKGMLRMLDGEKYYGEFKNDAFHGLGELRMANKSIYKGYFINGSVKGKGIEKYHNGDYYMGMLKAGQREGPGIYRWKEGLVYAGFYENSKKSGKGVYIYPNGEVFRGEFKNGTILRDITCDSTFMEDLAQFMIKKRPEWLKITGDFLTKEQDLESMINEFYFSLKNDHQEQEEHLLPLLFDSDVEYSA